MGKHREAERAARWNTLQALQNAALPAAILIVVGVVVFASPVLRPDDESPIDGSFSSAETTGDESESAEGRNRAGSDLEFQASIVPPTVFEKQQDKAPPRKGGQVTKPAQIPDQFVRVPRAATLPTAFTVSTFNTLGFGHTVRGGNKKGFADGRTRTGYMVDLLRGHDVSVAGLQEFQTEQFTTFNSLAGGEYAVYPGAAGGREGVRNSIAWRRSEWTPVQTNQVSVPYFGGDHLPMPYVLLQNVATGQHVWFANFHNPADARGNAERWRDMATGIEIALFNRLRSETGYPVVVTGDMNERDEYLCRAASGAGMHSADGGYVDAAGCHFPRPMQVDWILGTQDVTFESYVADRSPYVQRTSDHPLVVADALVAAAEAPADCVAPAPDSTYIYCPPA